MQLKKSEPWYTRYKDMGLNRNLHFRIDLRLNLLTCFQVMPDRTRKCNTLARRGGGESDAAFTPSPPVVLQPENQGVTLSLAHQTRIRNLYAHSENNKTTLRPDSSSSASSAADWDNGHATVLRRQAQNQVQCIC